MTDRAPWPTWFLLAIVAIELAAIILLLIVVAVKL